MDDVQSATVWLGWINFAKLLGAFLVAAGVVAEFVGEYVARPLEATVEHARQTELARLNEQTAAANERAANLERESLRLRMELDREVQKHAPRRVTAEQKAALRDGLKGKVDEIALVVENDPEADAFALQIAMVLSEAGISMRKFAPPPSDKWWAPNGLVMYSPNGSNEAQLTKDPLSVALKAANLYGGLTSAPFPSPQQLTSLISGYNGYILYIGEKSPW